MTTRKLIKLDQADYAEAAAGPSSPSAGAAAAAANASKAAATINERQKRKDETPQVFASNPPSDPLSFRPGPQYTPMAPRPHLQLELGEVLTQAGAGPSAADHRGDPEGEGGAVRHAGRLGRPRGRRCHRPQAQALGARRRALPGGGGRKSAVGGVQVTKKVVEYFGDAEESVISFVMEEVRTHAVAQSHSLRSFRGAHLSTADAWRQLAKRTGAAGMVTNLGPILESDCEDFVFKMWRMLIFEMLNQMP